MIADIPGRPPAAAPGKATALLRTMLIALASGNYRTPDQKRIVGTFSRRRERTQISRFCMGMLIKNSPSAV